MSENSVQETQEECLSRHKKEKKDLQAEIQKLKHGVPKGDKKKKKEINDQIAILEENLDARHKSELERLSSVKGPSGEENTELNGLCSNMNNASVVDQDQEKDDQQNHADDVGDESGFKFNQIDKKSSKARRRKEKKDQKSKEQEERVKDQELKNLSGPRVIEQNKILEILSKRGLTLVEIPSDGDCLYSAVCDQLGQRGIQTDVRTLRLKTSTHMLSHSDDFLPFLVHEESGDLYSPEKRIHGTIMDTVMDPGIVCGEQLDDEFRVYCMKVGHTAEWGGHTEIRALSDVHQMSVEVLQADGPSILIGEQFTQTPPLVVTYHRFAFGLGAHYNSVKPVLPVR